MLIEDTEIEGLKESEDAKDVVRREELIVQLEEHRRRSKRIPFIDPVDVRYNRFEMVPQPVTTAFERMRRPLAKVSPVRALTCIWLIPSREYSIGSSTVTIDNSLLFNIFINVYKVVVLPLPVGPVAKIMP